MYKGKYSILTIWSQLAPFERQNLWRAFIDTVHVIVFSCIGASFDDDDEDAYNEKSRTMQFIELICRRLSTEIRALHPIGIFDESRKLFKSPFPALKTINSCYDILASLITPEDWTEELASGPYKGMTRLEKNLYKAPVWGLVHYRQFSKAVGDVDEIINYYARPY